MNLKRLEPQAYLTWKERYMAALFELDKNRLDQRINEAETAIVQRTRELFQAGGDPMRTSQLRERHALETALDALRALRTVAHLHSSRPQAAVNDRGTWPA
jgi:hypothetical protein